ncbi:MAG: helix-turn-helix transcriptional regulator [Synergistaceae bacterium]|jgi:DNA-binding CsgD family transcriptional regulator|nr:helix-turn-helix transcriptional regulator [Synergistaceae bacterium]
MLFMYHSAPGKLDEELSGMYEGCGYYFALTEGRGSGGDFLMEAEAMLFRGDDGASEALCHKAIYEAREAGQTGNCLCAELILARIAILRGDAGAYDAARKSIVKDVSESGQTSILRIGDLCRAQTDMLLGNTDDLPSWLCETESIKKPDEVYLPFAEHAQYIAPLLESWGGSAYGEKMMELLVLCERQTAGINKIQTFLAGIKPVLTKRQREIALLIKDGLQAKEIAEKLFIAENTVKTVTKTIYEKLGVHSRIEIAKTSF